jgi:hypothetical protein
MKDEYGKYQDAFEPFCAANGGTHRNLGSDLWVFRISGVFGGSTQAVYKKKCPYQIQSR